ncbi:uncharacterized protein LOC109829052 [Asparagus officinalis]|uniref:uncharacterized protein LOC109829052 n=1 Tax=Asparagus officinalis TaxID=4686 RepID=UPI00098E4450|nr:uncharacterized protein LOC109829052 [Asparagus officinalis]
MDQSLEEFEPLFDYSRVQPKDLVFLDDEELDSSPIYVPVKKKQKSDKAGKGDVGKEEKPREEKVVVLDDEEDWLAPPPPKLTNDRSALEEDSTIKALRLKKQELASLAQSAEDILRTVTASTRRDISNPEKIDLEAIKELPSKKVDRKKIVISIQDKDGQKQFRMYMDDNFSRLFKMYAEKANLKLESLVFIFDGDKVSSTATPEGLGLEDDDMLEVHIKSK